MEKLAFCATLNSIINRQRPNIINVQIKTNSR